MKKNIKFILCLCTPQKFFQTHFNFYAELNRCVLSLQTFFNDYEIVLYCTREAYLHYNISRIPAVTVKFIHSPIFSFGYAFVHVCGIQAQRDFPDSILIHLDLDMCLIRPFAINNINETYIGGYTGTSSDPERDQISKYLGIKVQTNTNLIITQPGSTYYRDVLELYNNFHLKDKIEKYWFYEEIISDLVVQKNGYKVIKRYAIDE